MDQPIDRQELEFDRKSYDLKPTVDVQHGTDTAGYWFAAAVVFAFLAAGVIVYRTGNSEFRTASNDLPLTAQSSPIDPPPILQAR